MDGLDALADRGYFNERLDQLVIDVLLGVAMSVMVGLDVGTSGVKALAVAEDGEVALARRGRLPGSRRRKPGWSEQDPEDWWRATSEALEALDAPEVAGIGLTGQMHGLVALDASDEVIRPGDPVERPAHGRASARRSSRASASSGSSS